MCACVCVYNIYLVLPIGVHTAYFPPTPDVNIDGLWLHSKKTHLGLPGSSSVVSGKQKRKTIALSYIIVHILLLIHVHSTFFLSQNLV